MAISKKDRKLVFDKCGGKCAYCGCDLVKGWHVDHIEPVGRKKKYVGPHYINKLTKEKQDQITIIKLCQKEPDQAINWKLVPGRWVPDGYTNPRLNTIKNYLPACASCNINKHGMSIEEFRLAISKFIESLNQRFVQYKFAKKFGLIEETGKSVTFYFEKLGMK